MLKTENNHEKEKITMKERGSFILSYIKKYTGLYLLSVIFIISSSLLALIPPQIVGKIVNALTNRVFYEIVYLIFIMLGFTVSQGVIGYFSNRVYIFILTDVMARLRKNIFSTVINANNLKAQELDPGGFNTKLVMDVANVSNLFDQHIINIIIDIIKVTGIIVILFITNYKIAAVFSFQLIPAILIFYIFMPKIYDKTANAQTKMDKLFHVIYNYLYGLNTIKLLAIENNTIKKLKTIIDDLRNHNYSLQKTEAIMGLCYIIFPLMNLATIWLFGGFLIYKGELTLGGLISIQMYMELISGPFESISGLSGLISSGIVSLDRLLRLNKQANRESKNEEKKVYLKNGNVQIKDIAFSYKQSQREFIFKNLSLNFETNSFIAVIGKSGIGKSTLAKLLVRSFDADKGSIILQEHYDITRINKNVLREQISLIEGYSTFFGNTLQEALLLPEDGSLDDEAVKILNLLHLSEFTKYIIEKEPYDIGLNGIKFSDGQRHRMAIARSLLRKPKVLIIDEALKSLDIYIEHEVIKTLKHYVKNMTIILITHSLNFMNYFDQVLIMKNENDDFLIETMTYKNPTRELIVDEFLNNELVKN